MSSPRIEIVKELRALEQFCTFKAIRTGEESERFLKDYLADVQEHPLEAIQKACAEWRKSGATRFPTPGQLIPLIRKHVAVERSAGRPAPWRPLSDEAYERLTLAEKVRHHRIAASEARRKAGPMWKNPPGGADLRRAAPGHVAPEAMSERWRLWSARADNHDAEARRLAEKLHAARSHAA